MQSVALLAQLVNGFGLGHIAAVVIVVAALVAIVFVVVQAMGVQIPAWVIKIGWILLIAFVGILAIRLLLSM